MARNQIKLLCLLLFFVNFTVNATSKRGPKPNVPLELQKDVYLQFKDDFRNGIPPISSNVYSRIHTTLKYKMTIKSIKLSLQNNYIFFFGHHVQNKNNSDVKVKETLPISSEYLNSSEINSISTSRESSPEKDYSANFLTNDNPNSIIQFICIDKITWDEIKPNYYYYRRNDKTNCMYQKRLKMQINRWTNVIQGHLWEALKLCCTWCFKGNLAKNDFEIICKGYCKQCHANITVTSHAKTDNLIELKCLITNWNNDYKHSVNVKNHIRSRTRRNLSKHLENRSAASVRYTMASKIMKKKDKEPSVLPKLQTLRQIKHESRKSLFFHENTILSLSCMRFTPPYDKCVRFVSSAPFFVYYWTDEQINYYQSCQNTLNYIKLSIDATGSLFSKKLRPIINEHMEIAEKTQGPLFLYTIMTDTTKGSSVPLGQFISESHTMARIYNWLHDWLSERKPPDEVITDDSAALIGAVVKAFCDYETTNEYLEDCFKLLDNKSDKVPVCHVRLDTSHFLKTLYNLTVFKHVDTRIIHFYVQCLKQIKESVSYDQVKQILQDLIIVSNHKYRGTKDGHQTRCERSLQKLRNVISADKTEHIEQEINADHLNVESNNIFDDASIDVHNPLTHFIEDVDAKEKIFITLCELRNEVATNFENIYYFPLIKSTLLRLLRKLPIWGNVMCPFFQSDVSNPTSSNIESYFKDIKKLFFNFNFGKLRVDEFIIKHYTLITGSLRLGSSDLDSYKTEKEIDIYSLNEEDTLYDNSILKNKPKYVEDWRGLVSKKDKKNRNNKVTLHVLRNGTISTSGNSNHNFTNTCAFDSVIQSLAVGYIDNTRIKKYICEKKNAFSRLIQSLIKKKPKSKKQYIAKGIYEKRADILLNMFRTEIETNVIDCACNVSRIIDNIANYEYYSANRRLKCTIENCDVNTDDVIRKCSWIPLNTNIIQKEGLKALGKSALVIDPYRKCKISSCAGMMRYEYDLCEVIFFEFNFEYAMNIDDIPKTIELISKQYQVLAVIEYISSGKNILGHYRTLCFRSRAKIWQCYDDLLPTQTKNVNNLVTVHCITYIRIK